MKTSSAKAKGRKLQQHICKLAKSIFHLEDGDIESRPMGSGGVDLMMSPRARSVLPVSIECKNQKVFPSLAALKQSEANKFPDTYAAACWHPPGAPYDDSIIYMTAKDFFVMLNDINERHNLDNDFRDLIPGLERAETKEETEARNKWFEEIVERWKNKPFLRNEK